MRTPRLPRTPPRLPSARWRRVPWILILMLLAGTATPAEADTRRDRREQRLAQKADKKKDKLKRKIRTMRAIVLADELDLDEDTAARLFPILNKYDDEFAKLAADGVALRKQADDAEAAGDDGALDQAVDALVANRRDRWDLDDARFAEVRKVLSPAQAARILVVLPEIDRKILDGARKAVRDGKAGKASKKKPVRRRQ